MHSGEEVVGLAVRYRCALIDVRKDPLPIWAKYSVLVDLSPQFPIYLNSSILLATSFLVLFSSKLITALDAISFFSFRDLFEILRQRTNQTT